MARRLNPTAHAVRRDVFLDAAQHLIETQGYEQMSIQDVLDEVEASRGAFYHYFDSKAALLEAVVERLVSTAAAAVSPLVNHPELSATEKLEQLLSGIARWKAERRELMLALLRVWYSDDNALMRDKLRRQTLAGLGPLLATIIDEGRANGEFTTDTGDHTAAVLLTLINGAGEMAGELFFARQANAVSFDLVKQRLGAYATAIDRMLGISVGSLSILDDSTLRLWFG